MTIGSRIAKCRKEKNLSQEYIAEMLEVSRQAVSKWECDITEPDTGNLIALSNLLGVSVEYLAKGETAEKAVLVEKNLPTLKIIGIILIALGGLSCIMGVIAPLILSVGAISVFFGIFILLLQKEGLILGLSTVVLAISLFLIQGFTGGVDTPVMLLILSISVVLPISVWGIIKIIKKVKNKELPKIEDIKKLVNKKSVIITIVVILGIIASIVSGILVSNAREKAFRKSTWFSEEWLTECGLKDMPRIGGEYKAKIGESKVLVKMKAQENFEMYVSDHLYLMYLRERSFRHLGTRGDILSCDASIFTYELVHGDDISDFRKENGEYIFVVSNTRANFGKVDATVIHLRWVGNQSITVEGKPVSYNVIMSIYPDSHEESYAIRSLATYNISYEGDTSIYYSAPPMTAIASNTVVLRTHSISGAEIVLYANGERIEKTYSGEKYSEHTLVMPNQNVTITAEIVGGGADEPTVDSLRYYEGWLTGLTAAEVAEIKICKIYDETLWDEPFSYIKSTDDKEVIGEVLLRYQNMVMHDASDGWLPADGAGEITVVFTLSNGESHSINFIDRHYKTKDGVYYSVNTIPALDTYDDARSTFGLLVNEDSYNVYSMDGTAVSVISGLREAEFSDYLGSEDYSREDYLYYIETEVGVIYICSDTVFKFILASSSVPFCLELRGTSFGELINVPVE